MMSESSITPTLGTSLDLGHTQLLSFKGKDEAPNENQKKKILNLKNLFSNYSMEKAH